MPTQYLIIWTYTEPTGALIRPSAERFDSWSAAYVYAEDTLRSLLPHQAERIRYKISVTR